MNAYELNPPAKWRAGFVGQDKAEVFFSCCKCNKKNAEIAGFYSSDGTFAGVGTIKAKEWGYAPTLFCRACWEAERESVVSIVATDDDNDDALNGRR